MIEKIKNLDDKKAKEVLVDFMSSYLDKGFGSMNKTDIETLLYHVLKKHDILKGKCFEDSLALQITEAKSRKLIYEAQVKYMNRNRAELDAYLRKSIGECLTHAHIVKKKEIKFAIEDKFLRVALNAKLRENHYFADTSFNKDIVSLDKDAFAELIVLLVPNTQRQEVEEKFANLNLDDKIKGLDWKGYISGVVTAILSGGAIDALKGFIHILSL
jgi:hypothetical protein